MTDPRRHVFRMFFGTPGQTRRAVSWAAGQPGWVARTAAVAAVIVMACLILLLIVPALIVGSLLFLILSAYVYIRGRLRSWRTQHDHSAGRENVRVIEHRDEIR